MTIGLLRLGLVSMNTEATIQLNGIADQNYLNSFRISTGNEQQSLLITHSSTLPYSSGYIPANPLLSSTPYQWHELYEAWKLGTLWPSSHQILDCPLKGTPFTPQRDWTAWMDYPPMWSES